MKTKFLLPVLLSFSFHLLSSQIPQGLNYQAVIGDANGYPIRNTSVQMKISILSDTITPVIEWEELHSNIKSNLNGIVSLVIGSGVRQATSAAASFNKINWKTPQLFLKSQVYLQNTWKSMGSAKLWSVPYSMVAGELSGTVSKLAVTGSTSAMDEALFEVKNKDGQIVFAVYNEGVRVYVDNGSKGAKGGFSVGGFGDAKLPSQQLLFIDPDSIRAYINTNPVKGAKGGFSVGGFAGIKEPAQDLLFVGADSIRAYIDTRNWKGAKGGFSVGGFGTVKKPEEFLRITRDSARIYVNGNAKTSQGGFAVGNLASYNPYTNQFLQLTPENYFIGEKAGSSITTGIGNSFIGYYSGRNTTSGSANVFVGQYSGEENTTGATNIFVGMGAGQKNTTGNYNIFMGWYAGHANTTGASNLFIGNYAGPVNTTGMGNLFLGHNSGSSNLTGSDNLYIGGNSGMYNVSGDQNTFVGGSAGSFNTTGSQNTFVGQGSGYNNLTGMFNVAFGTSSAHSLKDNSNHNVFIGYSSAPMLTDNSSNNVLIGSASGFSLTGGSYNILIGKYAGQISSGTRNVFIGDYTGSPVAADDNVIIGSNAGAKIDGGGNVMIGSGAGQYETGSNKLFITNNNGSSDVALIYGEFDNELLKLNGTVKIRDLLKLRPRSLAPVNPEMGDVYFDSGTKKLMVFDGTVWQACW